MSPQNCKQTSSCNPHHVLSRKVINLRNLRITEPFCLESRMVSKCIKRSHCCSKLWQKPQGRTPSPSPVNLHVPEMLLSSTAPTREHCKLLTMLLTWWWHDDNRMTRLGIRPHEWTKTKLDYMEIGLSSEIMFWNLYLQWISWKKHLDIEFRSWTRPSRPSLGRWFPFGPWASAVPLLRSARASSNFSSRARDLGTPEIQGDFGLKMRWCWNMLELFHPKTLLGLFHPKILGSFLPDGFGVPFWKTLNLDRLGTILSESRSLNMVK